MENKEYYTTAELAKILGISRIAVFKKIKKGETKETIRRAFKLAEEVGLYTHASFMIGHPWDTPKTIQKTIDFAKEINADTAGFPITTPFPGTELWEMAKSNALLMTEDFRKYGPWFSPVMRTFSIEAKDLVRYEKKALVSYYFRWNYILKALKRILKYPPSWRAYVDPFKILLPRIL